MFKRLLTILAALALCACLLVGCGKDNIDSSEATKDTAPQETVLPTLSDGEIPVVPN